MKLIKVNPNDLVGANVQPDGRISHEAIWVRES